MKRCFCLIICAVWLLFAACGNISSHLPKFSIEPSSDVFLECRQLFSNQSRQYVHSIEATFPGGAGGFLVGAAKVIPQSENIDCAIMTLEGLTVLEASFKSGANPVVHKSLPPFDKLPLINRMEDDLRLLLLAPQGNAVKAGTTEDGIHTCRYQDIYSNSVDLQVLDSGNWRIRKYDKTGKLIRNVDMKICRKHAGFGMTVPCRMDLAAYGRHGYQLSMELISMEVLP